MKTPSVLIKLRNLASNLKAKLGRTPSPVLPHESFDLASAVRYIEAAVTPSTHIMDQVDFKAKRAVEYLLQLGRMGQSEYPIAVLKICEKMFDRGEGFYLFVGRMAERLYKAGIIGRHEFIAGMFHAEASEKEMVGTQAARLLEILKGDNFMLSLEKEDPRRLGVMSAYIVHAIYGSESEANIGLLKVMARKLYSAQRPIEYDLHRRGMMRLYVRDLQKQIEFLQSAASLLRIDDKRLTESIELEISRATRNEVG